MSNVLKAIKNIADYRRFNLMTYSSASRHILLRNIGEQIDHYIKDAFCDSFRKIRTDKKQEYPNCFAYVGSRGKMPNFVVKNGPAVIVRKLSSPTGKIDLHNYFPKASLKRDDNQLDESCRKCDNMEWLEKDLFYCIAYHEKSLLRYIYLVDGKCYVASRNTYRYLYNLLKEKMSILSGIAGIKFVKKTRDFVKLKGIDPLGRTQFKLKSQYKIKSPIKIFSSLYEPDTKTGFTIVSVLSKETYMTTPAVDRKALEKHHNFTVTPTVIKNPNKKKSFMDAVLIVGRWEKV